MEILHPLLYAAVRRLDGYLTAQQSRWLSSAIRVPTSNGTQRAESFCKNSNSVTVQRAIPYGTFVSPFQNPCRTTVPARAKANDATFRISVWSS